MAKNYYELKETVSGIGETLNKLDDQIEEKAGSVDSSEEAIKELKALNEKKEALQYKFNVLKESLKREQERMKRKTKPVDKSSEKSEKSIREAAFAQLVRNTMNKKAVGNDVYEALGDDSLADNDTTGGNKFLPKTVSTNILVDPVEKNPLRQISTITQIPNLEIPRLTFTLDDNGFIQDTETAKEIKSKGSTVAFTRNKFKVEVGMSETVLLGSNANLTQYVEQGLQNGVIVKERSVAFNPNPTKDNEKHMSFYDPSNNIKKVSGKDMFEAITSAVADLHESYREKATIVMSYNDYLTIIRSLANGSTTLYGAQPQQVLGKPVVFTDAAVKPIVGDFSYSHFNYDLNALYDQNKDIHSGIEYFVVTAWMDHRIKLSSAFRIVDVASASAGN